MSNNIDNTIASSGSFIGAVLETAGFYYQEMILESFLAPFNGGIGAFFYIFGAFIAILAIVQQGRYALGSWFLIGPCLFLLVINVQVSTYGSSWIFGDEARNSNAVREEVKSFLAEKDLDNEKPANVSWVFSWYTKLVSKTVNEVVRVINTGREQTDLLHQRRVDAFTAISNSVSDSAGFTSLLHHIYLFRCKDVIELGRVITDPNSMPDRDTNIIQYHNLLKRPVEITEPAAEYLAGLQAWDSVLFEDVLKGDQEAINDKLSKLAQETLDETSISSPTDFTSEKYYEYLSVLSGGRTITCSQAWDFSRLGILIESRKIVDSIIEKTREGLETSVDDEENKKFYTRLVHDLGKVVGLELDSNYVSFENIEQNDLHFGDLEKLYKGVGSYLFRNELNKGLPSAFLHEFTDKFSQLEIGAPGIRDIVEDDRKRLLLTEGQERTNIMTNASQLPYYQGVMLYFLSLLFPFFAIMLLIPGRHSGFAMWFGFYLWAKSWDIGFAVVMMVDDILFSIFDLRHKVNTEDFHITNGLETSNDYLIPSDAALAVRMVSEMDPTFQPATYYAIISTLLHSIPMVTAYLILGGMKGGTSLISQGMKTYSDHLSSGSFRLSSARWVVANTTQSNEHRSQVTGKIAQNINKGGVGYVTGNKGDKNYVSYENLNNASAIGGQNMGDIPSIDQNTQFGGIQSHDGKSLKGTAQYAADMGTSGRWASSFSNLQNYTGSAKQQLAMGAMGVVGKSLNNISKSAVNFAEEQGDLIIGNSESYSINGSYSQKTNSTNNLGQNIEVGYIGNDVQSLLAERQLKNFEELVSIAGASTSQFAEEIGNYLKKDEQFNTMDKDEQQSFVADVLSKYIVNSPLFKQGLSKVDMDIIMNSATAVTAASIWFKRAAGDINENAQTPNLDASGQPVEEDNEITNESDANAARQQDQVYTDVNENTEPE